MTKVRSSLWLASALALGCFAYSGTASAQGEACPAPPVNADDVTLVAAYAASPPSFDETAFTMETENLMANVYGGEVIQYKPVWWEKYEVCGAGTNQPGVRVSAAAWPELHSNHRALVLLSYQWVLRRR